MSSKYFSRMFRGFKNKIPTVFKSFYGIGCDKYKKNFNGTLSVKYQSWMHCLRPFIFLMQLGIPKPGKNFLMTGAIASTQENHIFQFDRDYIYPDGEVIQLQSSWEIDEKDRTTEFIGRRIGWRFTMRCDNQKILMIHDAFVIKLFNRIFPLPLHRLVVGTGFAEQVALSDNEMLIHMSITHFIFRKIYDYKVKVTLRDAA